MESIFKLELQQKLNLSLDKKIELTKQKIKAWYDYFDGKVYVSFSGGKDSTVLLHLARQVCPDIKAVFCNTGLEYPEIVDFVKTFDNVDTIKPKMSFKEVLNKYGFPIISKDVSQKIAEIRSTKSEKLKNKRLYGDEKGNGKIPEKWKPYIDAPFKISHKCCDFLKKEPFKRYEKENKLMPIVGTMVGDSTLRLNSYIRTGCDTFDGKRPMSKPLSFWSEKDIYDNSRINNVEWSKIYSLGYKRTGCMFCMFGVHMEKGENRFQRMKHTHPKLHNYCINKLDLKKPLNLLNVPYD